MTRLKLNKPKKNFKPNSIAVVIPTRGLIFSETLEEVTKNLQGYDYKFFISHDNPIPECFNIPTEQALEEGYEWIWYVEEDMVIPRHFISKAMKLKYPVVACDYPAVRKDMPDSGASTVLYTPQGDAFFTGMGCLLVHRVILEKIGLFTTDFKWDIELFDGILKFKQNRIKKAKDKRYGNQDVHFGIILYSNKIPIKVLPEKAGQRRVMEKPEPSTNGGLKIKKYTKVRENDVFGAMDNVNYGKLLLAMDTIHKVEVLPCE